MAGILDLAERRALEAERAAALFIPQDIDWTKYELPPEDRARVRRADEYAEAVERAFTDDHGISGFCLPWAKTHEQVRLRRGELSIWAGVNGHGKSMLLSHVMLGAMTQGAKVCIASLEMPPVRTLQRMVRQAAGGTPEDGGASAVRFLGGRLWLYDQVGSVTARRMVALVRYCRQELGVDHVVIDSLMKCGIVTDDYNGQKSFVDHLATTANQTGVSVHLVAHSRKRQSEHETMDKFDVKGASEITDMADNVFTVWRNKRKEEKLAAGELDIGERDKPDALLVVDKQRHGEWEGRIGLYFHPAAQQYVAHDGAPCIDYSRAIADGLAPEREPGSDDE